MAKRLYLFDIDGTLVRSFMRERGARFESGVQYHGDIYDRVEVLPGRRELLDKLREEGAEIAMVTNQGGVAFGYQTEVQINAKLYNVAAALGFEKGGVVEGVDIGDSYVVRISKDGFPPGTKPTVYVSLGHPNAKEEAYLVDPEDTWRKPGPGMIEQAIADYDVTPEDTVFVGDLETDQDAARRAGVDYVDAEMFFA